LYGHERNQQDEDYTQRNLQVDQRKFHVLSSCGSNMAGK